MKYAFIRAHDQVFPIKAMCRVLNVSRSGYYAARGREPGPRARRDRQLRLEVRAIHAESRRRYGSPRIRQELRARGIRCSRKRVARLMQADGLVAKKPRSFVVTTQAGKKPAATPNVLQRRFAVGEQPTPNSTWVADITYLPTREGWLYMAAILDLSTRAVVGWATDTRLRRELALRALRMALDRQEKPPLLHHSDQGTQYNSIEYQALLAHHGIEPSMSRKGDCWDNAVAESFFATLKWELVADASWVTRYAARGALFEFIEVWYNRKRRHSSLGYLSPAEYGQRLLLTRAAA